uniref:TIR domain-containing protein n=1 Tax=Steinernema glaseri TaxID=37863 RepID=A0A1I8AGS3_9BILA
MDSVPFSFCMDVLGRINAYSWHFCKMEEVLTGRLKAATRRYSGNARELDLKINCEEGEWGYSTIDYHDGDSLDEMLARDRRFLRFRSIDFGHRLGISDEFVATCSKEDICNRLIPLIVRQLRPCNNISLWYDDGQGSTLSRQHVRMFLDAFLNCKGFRQRCYSLGLPYFGPESEQFLTTMLEDDCNLDYLYLHSDWPHSDTLERLVLKFLSHKVICFGINGLEDGGLKLNPTILKAVFDAWYRAENSFSAAGPWNGDIEALLSIPVPQNVTRTQPKPKTKGEDESFIVWTKDNGFALQCMVRADNLQFFTDWTSSLD